MFGRSPKEKYAHYLAWFADQVSDEKNWKALRDDRDCANWQTNLQDEEGILTPSDPGKPIPWSYSEAMFRMSDPKKMAKALSKKIEANHQKYTDMSKYINGDPKQGAINAEYIARFENTKALREQLKAYTGSDEFASDELFRIKQEADATGKDFSQVAEQRVAQIKGEHIAHPPEPEKKPEPIKEPTMVPNWWERLKSVFVPETVFGEVEQSESYLDRLEQQDYKGSAFSPQFLKKIHDDAKRKKAQG